MRTARPVPAAGARPDPRAAVPPLLQQRDALVDAYRPRPDRRFLLAVSAIHALATGEPPSAATVAFSGGSWTVKHKGVEVGHLPEIPTYDDGASLLGGWASTLLKAHPFADPAVPSAPPWALPSDDAAFTVLEAAQHDWTAGPHTGALVARAAHALVALQFRMEDHFELADAIGGHAMALVAVEKALGGADVGAEDDALLARALGYWGAAGDRARRLDAGSVVRAFLLRDDATLEHLTQAVGADPGSRTFLLRRLATTHQWRRERALLSNDMAGTAYTLPVLFDRFPSIDFSRKRELSYALPRLVLLEALRRGGDARAVATARALAAWKSPDEFARASSTVQVGLGVSDGELLDAFDGAALKLAPAITGPLFSGGLERAYYKASLYTGLWSVIDHTVLRWGALEAAQEALTAWGTGGGDAASDFRLWAQELIDAKTSKRAATDLLATIKDLPHLGPNAHTTLLRELMTQGDWGDARVSAAARTVASHLDTRLEHRRTLVHIAETGLRDLALTERIGRGLAAAEAPLFSNEASYVTWITRDIPTYKARLADPSLDPVSQGATVRNLRDLGEVSDADTLATLRRLVAANKDPWTLREALVDELLRNRGFDEARATITSWLAENRDKPGLETLSAETLLARTYLTENKYADAWKVLEPIVDSQYDDAMLQATTALEALGRRDDAERIAKARFERYHAVAGLVTLVGLYWKHGKNDEATKLLVPTAVPLSLEEQAQSLGPALATAFEGRPDADLVAAFQSLAPNGQRFQGLLTHAIEKAGRKDLAFELSEPLVVPGVDGFDDLMRSYSFLEANKGHAEAVTWLRSHIGPRPIEALPQFAISIHADPLLWEVEPSPDPNRHDNHADNVWLFRALSVARGTAAAHKDEVLKHFAGPPGGRHDVIGRHILGLASEADVLALAAQAHDACEVAFWIGRGAQAKGDLFGASEWYRISLETGLSQVWEYREAYTQLYGWWHDGKALSLVQAGK